MAKAHDPDKAVAKVLARFKSASNKRAMARATLVVDENVSFLCPALKEAKFHVVSPQKGVQDHEIKRSLLVHRTLVTKNTKDFLSDAPVFDYGIIGLEGLAFIDADLTLEKNKTAQMISRAVSDFSLVSERSGYVLMLKPNGKHVFKRIE